MLAFSKPPIGKRGYNEDVKSTHSSTLENGLSRLIEENADLRQRVEANWFRTRQCAAPAVACADRRPSPLYGPSPGRTGMASRPRYMKPRPPLRPPRHPCRRHHVRPRVLALAQDTADRLTSGAQAESEKMLSDARANAEALVSEGAADRGKHRRRRPGVRMPYSPTRRPGPEAQLRQIRKADALQADAEHKHTEIAGQHQPAKRTVLEGRRQLHLEREYRTRLKTYLSPSSKAPVSAARPRRWTVRRSGVHPVQPGAVKQ